MTFLVAIRGGNVYPFVLVTVAVGDITTLFNVFSLISHAKGLYLVMISWWFSLKKKKIL